MEEMIGKAFGKWCVIGIDRESNRKRLICKCSCKNKTIKSVDYYTLKNGKTESCGCIHKDRMKERWINFNKSLIVDGKKLCSKCKRYLQIEEFAKTKNKINGQCISCKRETARRYRERNSEKYKIYREKRKQSQKVYQKEYRKQNNEKNAIYQKAYRKRNRSRLLKAKNEYYSDDAKYKTFKGRLTTEECIKKGTDGKLLVKCSKCKIYFTPTNIAASNRVGSLNGKYSGENRLYCSDKCKKDCDVYHSKTIPKSLRGDVNQSRCNQNVNKKSLLGFQIDKYNYTFCEKCGTKTKSLFIHHNVMVSLNHSMADDMSHQILVCNKCHTHEGCL